MLTEALIAFKKSIADGITNATLMETVTRSEQLELQAFWNLKPKWPSTAHVLRDRK